MIHERPTEESQETAALYALGTLSQTEARAFEEHLAAGCAVCEAELQAFESVVAGLAFGAPEQEPPAEVREKLAARLAQESPPGGSASGLKPLAPTQFFSLRAAEGEWHEIAPGILQKRLFADQARGTVTSLYRLLPGARAARHQHQGAEECYVIEGDFHVNEEVLGPGDYHCAMDGSVHETAFTVDGTLLLIVVRKSEAVSDSVSDDDERLA